MLKLSQLNILIAGKGGQGVILTNQILANIFLKKNLNVKTAAIHGMAQRGGSVVSHLRCGEGIHSPTIPQGVVDYILSLDDNEAIRWQNMLRLNQNHKGKILKLSVSETQSLVNVQMKNIVLLTQLVFDLQYHPLFSISIAQIRKQVEINFTNKPDLAAANLALFEKTFKKLNQALK